MIASLAFLLISPYGIFALEFFGMVTGILLALSPCSMPSFLFKNPSDFENNPLLSGCTAEFKLSPWVLAKLSGKSWAGERFSPIIFATSVSITYLTSEGLIVD